MSKISCGFLLLAFLYISHPGYTQDKNKEAEKYARFYCQMLAGSCSMAPKNFVIRVDKRMYNPDLKLGPVGWKIWSEITWRGQISRMNYKVSVCIEVNEPVNGKPGKATVFFLDYSYLLGFRCIKDENTRPVRLMNGKVKFCRYREFEFFKL